MTDLLAFGTAREPADALDRVVAHLHAGGLLVYPTETVYGIGCVLDPAPLAALARAKRQGREAPFLLVIPDDWRSDDVRWTEPAERLAAAFWPGPLTLALDATPGSFPSQVTSAEGTVALRRSPHGGVRRIVNALGAPMTSTSANRPGEPAARSAEAAADAIRALAPDAPVLVLDGGALDASPPSTLVHAGAAGVHVLRAGAISPDAIRRVLGDAHVE